jgi:DNA helicase TIP49 (TBP-interacting protein)
MHQGCVSKIFLFFLAILQHQANVLAKTLGMDEISVDDITAVSELFMDAKSSARILHEHEDKYLY